MIIASLGWLSFSFGASAAVQQVNAEQAKICNPSAPSPYPRRQCAMDMRQELAAKAEKKAPAATVLLKHVPAIARHHR